MHQLEIDRLVQYAIWAPEMMCTGAMPKCKGTAKASCTVLASDALFTLTKLL
jgi:hypothetical protein